MLSRKYLFTLICSLMDTLPFEYRKKAVELLYGETSTDMDKLWHKAIMANDMEKFKAIFSCKQLWLQNYTDQYDLVHSLLMNACLQGSLQDVRFLLSSPTIPIKVDINHQIRSYNTALSNACRGGHLEVVKYLLTSPELKTKADIHQEEDTALVWACSYGHLEVAKYLLTSPELVQHANIHALHDKPLNMACAQGQAHIVRYLLTDPELKAMPGGLATLHQQNKKVVINRICHAGHVNVFEVLLQCEPTMQWIKEEFDKAFLIACEARQLPMIDFILAQSPKSIHTENDHATKFAWEMGHLNIINHLIFHHNVPMTPSLDEYCKEKIELKHIFEKRDLCTSLSKNLQEKEVSTRRKI